MAIDGATKAHIICCNDGIMAAVLGLEKKAKKEM